MIESKFNLRTSVLITIILLAAFSRVIPHMPNFSPLGAIGLFGAAYFAKKWQAFLIPLCATWLSDLFINNVIYAQYYPNFTWFYDGFYWQYGSYLIIIVTGMFIFKKINPTTVIAGAITSSTLFFLISNFGCWIGNSMYSQNLEGLISCYIAGIPFIKGTILGDLFYAISLFGLFSLAQNHIPALRTQQIVG